MANNLVTIDVAGACPCCGSPMKDISFILGSRYLTIFHVADDMSRFSNDQLLGIGLCDIDRTTGEKIRRNYKLQGEQ